MLDLSPIPIIDGHCHAFYLSEEPLGPHDLEEQVGLLAAHTPQYLFPARYHTRAASAVPPERRALDEQFGVPQTWAYVRRAATSTIFFRLFLKRLARFLDCEPTVAAVTVARNEAAADMAAYAGRLLRDASVQAMVIDEGMPRPLDVDGFIQAMPIPVRRLLNMRATLEDLMATHETFDDIAEAYRAEITDAVQRRRYVGLKSHFAYTSGLDVWKPSAAQAREAFSRFKRGESDAWKEVDSYFFRLALTEARRLGVPVQIHTGVGGVGIYLNRCNPLLLEDVLKDDALHGTMIVLLHAGYPWASEVGFLTNAFPNVYADISFTLPYTHASMPQHLLELLELAPLCKVMYGSDTYLFPELQWLTAHLARQHLGAALERLVQAGAFTSDEAEDAALDLLHNNAARLYGLDVVSAVAV